MEPPKGFELVLPAPAPDADIPPKGFVFVFILFAPPVNGLLIVGTLAFAGAAGVGLDAALGLLLLLLLGLLMTKNKVA